jgi:hypothetical protein
MTKKQNKEILEFVKKLVPHMAEQIQEKINASKGDGEELIAEGLTCDTINKTKEFYELIEKEKVVSQKGIEVLIAISANAMLLSWVIEKNLNNVPMANLEMIP